MTLRGRLLCPKPDRSKTMTRYFFAARSTRPLETNLDHAAASMQQSEGPPFPPRRHGTRLIKSRNFLVIGAYPTNGGYDECTDTRGRVDAAKRIAKVRKPVFGAGGP